MLFNGEAFELVSNLFQNKIQSFTSAITHVILNFRGPVNHPFFILIEVCQANWQVGELPLGRQSAISNQQYKGYKAGVPISSVSYS